MSRFDSSRLASAPSLHSKLKRASLGTVVLALLLVTITLTYVQFDGNRRSAINAEEAIAKVISQNLGATVLFRNDTAALEVLHSLEGRPGMTAAGVFLPDGTLFAAYPQGVDKEYLRMGLEIEGHQLDAGRLSVRTPIMVDSELVGQLVMVSALQSFSQWFQSTAVIVLPILLVSIALAGMLARRQVNAILSPLDVFRQAMRCVGEGRTSGLYMPKIGDRELKPLVNGFNEMVEQLNASRRALSESEERYRSIVESQTESICRLDRHFQVTFTNGAFLEMVGYDRDTLYGERPARLIPPEDCKYIEAAHAKLSPQQRSAAFACRLTTADGEIRWIEATLSAVFDDLERISEYLIVARDVSKQRVAEQMAIQTSKLATLGEISTSIAHELKQPLSVMDMIAQNMMETLKEEDFTAEEMRSYAFSKAERIASSTARLRAVIEHLRMFGRKVDGETQVFDSRESLKAALMLIQHRFERADIRLSLRQPQQPLPVRGHTILFEQVLLNLLNNAADALEALPAGSERKVTVELCRTDNLLSLLVEDTAGGMPDALLQRALEPYFTTKPADRGTGLGLSISSEILRDMEGGLSLKNGETGLQATITVPLVQEASRVSDTAAAQ
ncbi:MAG: PAS domain S-box protein [Limibacillus sp.]